VVRWRRKDLVQWIVEEFAISLDETTVGRELRALGFAKLSARPRHYAQNEFEVAAFKKTPRRAGGHPGQAPAGHRDRTLVG
jgi:transposase